MKRSFWGGVFVVVAVLCCAVAACSNPAVTPYEGDYEGEDSENGIPKPAISLQPRDAGYFTGDQAEPLTVTATVKKGTPSYQWYSNKANNTLSGTPIDGATKTSYTPPTDISAVGTTYYYVVVTTKYNSKTARTASNPAKITVKAINAQLPVIDIVVTSAKGTEWPGPYTQDEDVTFKVTMTSPDGGSLSYQLYRITGPGDEYIYEGGDELLNGNSGLISTAEFTYKVPTDTKGYFLYYVSVTNIIGDNGDGGKKEITTADGKMISVGIELVKITGLKVNDAEIIYSGGTDVTAFIDYSEAQVVTYYGSEPVVPGGGFDTYINRDNAAAAFKSKDVEYEGAELKAKEVIFTGYSLRSGVEDYHLMGIEMYNDDVVYATTSAVMKPLRLTISAPTGTPSKTYNGGVKVYPYTYESIDPHELTNVVDGDVVAVKIINATYADPNVGTDIRITIEYAIDGADKMNYLPPEANDDSVTGVITQRSVKIIVTANNRVYNGSDDKSATLKDYVINPIFAVGDEESEIGNVISHEELTADGTVAFTDDGNVGTGKALTLTGWTLTDGTGLGNYKIGEVVDAGVTNITPAPVTISIGTPDRTLIPIDSDDTTYDTTAKFDVTLTGLIGSDTVTVNMMIPYVYGLSLSDNTDISNTTPQTITLTYNDDVTVASTTPVGVVLISGNNNYRLTAASALGTAVFVKIIDGKAADRAIPLTTTIFSKFNDYARTNGLARHYKLIDDITLTAPGAGASNWTAIGTSFSNSFTGSFDGDGKKITGLTIVATTGNQGMFGYIGTGGVVKNLTLEDVSITDTSTINNIGGVAGYNSGTVENCNITGTSEVSGSGSVGGVVGNNEGGTVSNCETVATVSKNNDGISSNFGGVVGYNSQSGTVSNCTATGDVSADEGTTVGGVVGLNSGPGSTVDTCYATGDVSSTSGSNVGGVAGTNTGTVKKSHATGAVSSDSGSNIGGVVGNNTGTVEESYATKAVSSDSGSDIGGVAGTNTGTVKKSYAEGDVSGGGTVGGVVGNNSGTASMVQNSYYTTGTVKGSASVGGVAGNNAGTVQNCYATGEVEGTDENVGGVVGNNKGTVRNCVALSNEVTTSKTTDTSIGRVVGIHDDTEGGTLASNYAKEDMTVNYSGGTKTATSDADDIDGEDISDTEYESVDWWKNANIWTIDNTDGAFEWNFVEVWGWHDTEERPILLDVGP